MFIKIYFFKKNKQSREIQSLVFSYLETLLARFVDSIAAKSDEKSNPRF